MLRRGRVQDGDEALPKKPAAQPSVSLLKVGTIVNPGCGGALGWETHLLIAGLK